MIVRAQKAEQRIVQPRFLQTEENRIGAVERAESALGQTALRFAGRFVDCGKSQSCNCFASALFENAQNVSRLAQVETRQRIDERQDAVQLGVLWRDRRVIDQASGAPSAP